MILGGCFSIPSDRHTSVSWHAFASIIHVSEIVLGIGNAAFSSSSEPLNCSTRILRNSRAVGIGRAEIELCRGVSLLSCLPTPVNSPFHILSHTYTKVERLTQTKLCFDISS